MVNWDHKKKPKKTNKKNSPKTKRLKGIILDKKTMGSVFLFILLFFKF